MICMKPILKKAEIRAIFVNGATASKLYDRYLEPELKVPAIRLPSTSPANAAWSLEKLEAEWKVINEYLD